MTKAEKKALFNGYTKTLDEICDKKDLIDKLRYKGWDKDSLKMHYDSLENFESFSNGFEAALNALNLRDEYWDFYWSRD